MCEKRSAAYSCLAVKLGKFYFSITELTNKLYFYAAALIVFLVLSITCLRISCLLPGKKRLLKTIFIIRHAKSDQSFFGNDFERPLNVRGRTDAPVMAKQLLAKTGAIDAFISSPAVRAKCTAELFATAFQIPTDEIIFISALYHAPEEVFYDIIAGLPESINKVAIFAHNPGITHFVNSLNSKKQVDNMPTCAIFAAEADITRWVDFFKAKKEFMFFDHPKK